MARSNRPPRRIWALEWIILCSCLLACPPSNSSSTTASKDGTVPSGATPGAATPQPTDPSGDPGLQPTAPLRLPSTIEPGVARSGGDLRVVHLPREDPELCRDACNADSRCRSYTYAGPSGGTPPQCHIKDVVTAASPNGCCTSGVKLTATHGFDRPGDDYRTLDLDGPDIERCATDCANDASCRAYSVVPTGSGGFACHLKSRIPRPAPCPDCIVGHEPPAVGLREDLHLPSGGPPHPAEEDASGELGILRQPLAARQSSIWTTTNIPVCWEQMNPTQATERGWVRNRVQATWQANSTVQFTGWGACTPSARGIRIQVADTGPHTKGLGSSLDGKRNGMVLNFTFANWQCTPTQSCIEDIAVHEFGHALGFSHEQNRDDAPAWCRDQAQGTEGDIFMTPFDLQSVMNYCNPAWNNNGNLSASDIAGLQFWYGPAPSSGVPWIASCQTDPLLFEHKNYGGKRLRVSGTMEKLDVDSFNDRASSLCVPAGYRLVIYEHTNFQGRSATFNGPIGQLGLSALSAGGLQGWNDTISSLELIDTSTGSRVYDAPPLCQTNIVLFEHTFFRGGTLVSPPPLPKLSARNMNDKLSSLCVPAGSTITMWEHSNYSGKQWIVVGPTFLQQFSPLGWNDRVSSLQ